MIIGKDGTLLIKNAKIVDEFKNMFETLLNQTSRNTIIEKRAWVEQNLETPIRTEVDVGLEILKNGKSAG